MSMDRTEIGVRGNTQLRRPVDDYIESDFYAPLTDSLITTRGRGLHTYTRETAAWSFDNEGKLNQNVPSGCARFKGGRLVRNLIPTSNTDNLTISWAANKSGGAVAPVVTANYASILAPNGTATANRIVFDASSGGTDFSMLSSYSLTIISGNNYLSHFWARTTDGSIKIIALKNIDNSGSGYTLFTITGEWQQFSKLISNALSATVAFAVRCRVSEGTSSTADILFWRPQVENITGQFDQTPSEYVSVGVLSSPYHGAGVDGCKWFPTNKDGSAIPSSTLEGYFAEPQRTNNCLWNRDLTNVAWTNTNITAAKTAIGLDNVANSATRLTAAATDATITQLLTAATGTRTFSAYIKRISGSGTISLTRNGGTNWTDITSSLVTGSWVLVKMTSDVGANPTVGIKMGTSGDVIDVDCVQDENGAWATSPILTTTAAVTRDADVLSYANAFDVAQGTALCSLRSDVPVNSGSNIYALQGGTGGNASFVYTNSADARTISRAYDGANAATVTSADITTGIRKKAVRWGTDLVCAGDGILGTVKPFDGSMGVSSTLFVGCNSISTEPLSGTIRDVHIWNNALTNSQLQQVTI